MRTITQWLDEYQQSHRNPVNKRLHWLCIPPIVLSVIGLLRAVPLGGETVNAASLALLLALAYYAMLSWQLAAGMGLVLLVLYALAQLSFHLLGGLHVPAMIAVFVLAWVGQFVGHRYEGAKPSFFKDVFFLLIGPLWLLADVYRRLDLQFTPRAARA